jgi:hypothetical protein
MLKKFFTVFTFIFLLLFFVPNIYASTFYLSPKSVDIPQGSIVPVKIGLNTEEESVNGISAYLSYSEDKLEVAWITYEDSFPITAEEAYTGGVIKISRGNMSGIAGNMNVATIGFRGKAQGSTTVSFVYGSGTAKTSDSTDSLNLGESTGGLFNVVASVQEEQAGTATASATKDQKTHGILKNLRNYVSKNPVFRSFLGFFFR